MLSFVKIVLSNSIQCSKVTVDKESLLYDKSKIYSTELSCCWVIKDLLLDLFKSSTISFNRFIWSKTDQDPCILEEDQASMKTRDNFFAVGVVPTTRFSMTVLGFIKKRSVFLNMTPLMSLSAVFYLSASANQKIRDAMEDWVVAFLEHGWYSQSKIKSVQFAKLTFPKDDVYLSVSEFTKQNTIVKVNLEYENFRMFFYLLLFINSVVALLYFLFEFRSLEVTHITTARPPTPSYVPQVTRHKKFTQNRGVKWQATQNMNKF